MRWRSKQYYFNKPISFNWIRVDADSYPVTFKMFGNGLAAFPEFDIDSDVARRIPVARDVKEWETEVDATADINQVMISTSMVEV